ncbi:MAG: DUF4019 domain-containing protein [Candidatus Zixiibacteriota bacterium]
MKLRILFMLLIIIIMSFILSSAADIHAEKESAAVEASEKWLSLVDDEKYGESWESSSQYFKNSITIEEWKKMLAAVRKPLGKVKSRSLKSKQFMTELPGAPNGEYVVIQYETSFENKKSAIETITPMLDKDGKWKVSGYFIK